MVHRQEIRWFVVTLDEEAIHLSVRPPLRRRWKATIPWASISRVCFKAEDPSTSDGIYIFTSLRPESWAIPAEAVGGSRLFKELIRKKLYDAQLAITAMGATSGLFCWPPDR